MDATTAETFLAVLELGSFSNAAKALNVTQSTVSARIRTLEDQLGRRLLTRSKAGVAPTRAGHHFRPYAEQVVEAWRRGRQEVLLPDRFDGIVAIGSQYTLWNRLVLDWLPWMRAEMPTVAVRAEVGSADQVMHGVAAGLLDMAVLYSLRARPGVAVEVLMEDTLVLAGTRRDPAVTDGDYVHVEWGGDFAVQFPETYPEAEMAGLTTNHAPLGLQHVLAAGGCGYFPVRALAPHVAAGAISVNPDAPAFAQPVHLAYQPGRGDKRFKRALDGLRRIAAEMKE
jgi:DNA-binding transcriptional LysR family regulator